MKRYVQSHVRPGAYTKAERPFADGLAITWFDSVDEMRASAGTEAYARVLEDGAVFIDGDASPTVLATELTLVGSPGCGGL